MLIVVIVKYEFVFSHAWKTTKKENFVASLWELSV